METDHADTRRLNATRSIHPELPSLEPRRQDG